VVREKHYVHPTTEAASYFAVKRFTFFSRPVRGQNVRRVCRGSDCRTVFTLLAQGSTTTENKRQNRAGACLGNVKIASKQIFEARLF